MQTATVAAHEKHRAMSAVTMHRQISAGSVQGGLFWATRRAKKATVVKQRTMNAQQRSEQRANLAQIQAIRRANGSRLGPLRGIPALGPGAVVQGLSHLDRARLDLDTNRTRGMSR
ncbi:hypothetical protein SAMN05421595_0362 [Austwickia chelonae]|uniref:Uncharacterized protein n=1 Tax=Austwickia chelonae NBRC 105200 TaxID=1184607 RepID=K6W7P7_9MICO|nr:hypothetical protein [Austwickia chelonae]GAB77852.1 hypothetical protein AUCHE_08_00940 [Austwickia chelonae NBRC 105200]SEV90805.1 hypothetical protein SAMN05421595_0362 [Austwickia chelonae]